MELPPRARQPPCAASPSPRAPLHLTVAPPPTEWLWPTGYFLRAYALLHTESHAAAARLFVLQRLAALTTGACRSRHGVIPRLTLRYQKCCSRHGSGCPSCRT